MEDAEKPNIPRATLAALGAFVVLALMLVGLVGRDLPGMHGILDSALFILSAIIALVLWDMGERLDRPFKKWLSIAFAVTSAAEFGHTMVSVEWTSDPELLERLLAMRPLTWPPAALALPLGIGATLAMLHYKRREVLWFAVAAVPIVAGLFLLYRNVQPYTEPSFLGVTRPSLFVTPILWALVGYGCWKFRSLDRALPTLVLACGVSFFGSVAMLYSREPHDPMAMVAHLARITGDLAILLSLMHMASLDMVERVRAEAKLARSNEDLEIRVKERTVALAAANTRAQAQLERLALLHQITRAIGERQDIGSISQVAVRSVEDHFPADFACLCTHDRAENVLRVDHVGAKSAPLASTLAILESARIEIDQNGLSQCLAGNLVYEPDVVEVQFPFPQRLARANLRAFVAAPLQVEGKVFGILIVGRLNAQSFSSGECEFLRQLAEHVALASHHAQLYAALLQAYEDLRQTQQAVMQQERLRALGQMASDIAHDFNNALSPIALYAESLLEKEPHLTAEGRAKIEIIQRAIDDAAHTVGRMKDFYRQREPDLVLTAVSTTKVLQQVLDLTQVRWRDMANERGHNIEIKTDFAPDTPAVLGVESELREALINLVFNAVDALPTGGVITLRTKRVTAHGGPGRVQIDVLDNGVGMSEATQQRCLEPFFTTKGDRGSGLGLAMVHGTIRRHNGELEIRSAPGEGTLVRLILEIAPDEAAGPAVLTSHEPIRPLRVLVIDDDPILLRSLRDVLEGDGHDVVAIGDGAEGVAAFQNARESDKPFDLVFTDLGMPQMDGRRVAAAIKTIAADTPIILLTGWGERLMGQQKPAHIDTVLSKPPKLRELRLAMAQASQI